MSRPPGEGGTRATWKHLAIDLLFIYIWRCTTSSLYFPVDFQFHLLYFDNSIGPPPPAACVYGQCDSICISWPSASRKTDKSWVTIFPFENLNLRPRTKCPKCWNGHCICQIFEFQISSSATLKRLGSQPNKWPSFAFVPHWMTPRARALAWLMKNDIRPLMTLTYQFVSLRTAVPPSVGPPANVLWRWWASPMSTSPDNWFFLRFHKCNAVN